MSGGRRAAAIVALFAAGLVAVYAVGPADLLTADGLLARRAALRAATDANPILALGLYLAGYVAAMSLALPVTAALSLLGGFLFGFWLGAAAVLVAATMGALVLFLIARSSLGSVLRGRAGPLYGTVADAIRANGFSYLLAARIVPALPFAVVTLAAALANLSVRTFLLATALGMAPLALVFASLGGELGRVASVGELLSPTLAAALTALGALALAPALYRRVRRGSKL